MQPISYPLRKQIVTTPFSGPLVKESVTAVASSPIAPILESISVSFAWATVKLRAAHAGQCIRLRRASDNAESDFAFNDLNSLDVDSITVWLGGSNGFLVEMYDQSGNNRDANQTTALQQPQYRKDGIGGLADFIYNGTSHNMINNSLDQLVTGSDIPWTDIFIADTSDPSGAYVLLGFGNSGLTNPFHSHRTTGGEHNSGRRGTSGGVVSVGGGTTDTNPHSWSLSFAGTTVRLWDNNSIVLGPVTQDLGTMSVNTGTIGALTRTSVGGHWPGHISLVIFQGGSELSDVDRATIDTNSIDVYGIT